MCSWKKVFAITLTLVLNPLALLAQNPSSSWSTIETLKPNTKVIVITRNGREFEGEKRQSTDDTLFMATNTRIQGPLTISLSRNEIGEVRQKKNRWIFPVIGAAIGFGVGLGIGQSYDRRGGDDPGLGKLLLGPLGALMGFAGGSFVPRKPKTIYIAP